MKKSYYYVSAHTANGLVNYMEDNLSGIRKVIVLEHPAHHVKDAILNAFIKQMEKISDIEIIYSPYGEKQVAGILIKKQSLAILSDEIDLKTIARPSGGQQKDRMIIPLTSLDDEQVERFKQKQHAQLRKVYDQLFQARETHDQLEEITVQRMDFSKADEMADRVIEELLQSFTKQSRTPIQYRRLFGVTQPQGFVDVVPQLIQGFNKRIYLQGDAGNGKSFFMRRVAHAIQEHGYDIEIYHCGFDPDSIDMVRVPSMDFCIFDSTYPHEYYAENEQDITLDLREGTIVHDLDDFHKNRMTELTSKYKKEMEQGRALLENALVWQDRIESEESLLTKEEIETIIHEILTKL